jgi:hypothetical protein
MHCWYAIGQYAHKQADSGARQLPGTVYCPKSDYSSTVLLCKLLIHQLLCVGQLSPHLESQALPTAPCVAHILELYVSTSSLQLPEKKIKDWQQWQQQQWQ